MVILKTLLTLQKPLPLVPSAKQGLANIHSESLLKEYYFAYVTIIQNWETSVDILIYIYLLI